MNAADFPKQFIEPYIVSICDSSFQSCCITDLSNKFDPHLVEIAICSQERFFY
jgi:hypothetical protein